MPDAVLGGTATFWREWGQGPRRAVAIHCSLASSAAWSAVAERLADRVRIEAFDLPGHGRSGPWDEARDIMDQTVAMAAALIGAGPVDLLGHSFGAVAALRLALERPASVRSLSLYEPVLFAAAPEADPVALFAPFAEAMTAGDRAVATRRFLALWGAGEEWADLPAGQRAALAARIHLVPAGNDALFCDAGGLLAPGRLEGAGTPALLLRGDRSPAVVAAIARTLGTRLRDSREVVVPGAGHMGPITHPDAVAHAIGRHLGG